MVFQTIICVLFCTGLAISQQCGRPLVQPFTGSNNDRIVGGRLATPNSWPWQVSLLRANGGHFCGGSLINSQWIITAAHCMANAVKLNVKLGEHNLFLADEGETIIPAAPGGIYVHPGYNRMNAIHDIAMIKLSRPVTFSKAIQPVCLPVFDAEIIDGQDVYVTGWGHTGVKTASPILKQVMVPTINFNKCSKMSPRYVSTYSICTGTLQGGHNPCFGDSGGPLVYQEGDQWYLHGVVSWGPQKCAIKEEPAVFVKVAAYLTWIEQNMMGS